MIALANNVHLTYFNNMILVAIMTILFTYIRTKKLKLTYCLL